MGTPPGNVVPNKVMNQIYEDHGTNPNTWPQELQDLFDPTLEAIQLNAPMSGAIKLRKRMEFWYHWAKDVCGAVPDHNRVESLRAVGWEFATTDDVVMEVEDTVKNRRGGKPDGYSNEIRNGDLRLVKLGMLRWRQKRKAETLLAFQMAYPQAFGPAGEPMKAENLVEKLRNRFLGSDELKTFEDRRIFSSAAQDIDRASREEAPLGNTSVHKSKKE